MGPLNGVSTHNRFAALDVEETDDEDIDKDYDPSSPDSSESESELGSHVLEMNATQGLHNEVSPFKL